MEDPLPCARQSIALFAKKNSFHFSTKIEKPTNTPFKFLPTFPQKIYGAADTAEEVDMQLKFTFFFIVISRSFFTENPMVDKN